MADPSWKPGEFERYLEFFHLRALRAANQGRIDAALLATDYTPYLDKQNELRALVRDTQQKLLPPDEDYPDSEVVKNVGNW